ncbi:EF-hand calcium-binding domain-containing protein 11 isoform 2-T2 [Anomaloglossus baeobatrachus]|uniref:EF-hand calcium-binding domain-containing protein 11 isoform X2 n=1 Tax=Anomaloglossus baeobatrachus TaxID=238106 RepID=UPI003F50A1B3
MFSAGTARGPRGSERRKKLLQVFGACDDGRKGYLSREDLKVAVVMLFGYKPSKMEVDTMVPGLSKTGVTPDDFVTLMTLKSRAQRSWGDHRQIFSVFDTHCRGFLNLDDFKRGFQRVAPRLSEQTIIEAFRIVAGKIWNDDLCLLSEKRDPRYTQTQCISIDLGPPVHSPQRLLRTIKGGGGRRLRWTRLLQRL